MTLLVRDRFCLPCLRDEPHHFRKPTAFSKWVFVFAGLGVALILPGFLGGKEFKFFFGCLGGMWIMVALLVAVVVAWRGKGRSLS